jgi:hypothetical protein
MFKTKIAEKIKTRFLCSVTFFRKWCHHHYYYHHHHHHHISVMELGHLLTRSGLTYPEISSKVCLAGPEAKGSSPTTGLTLLWARNPSGEALTTGRSHGMVPLIR